MRKRVHVCVRRRQNAAALFAASQCSHLRKQEFIPGRVCEAQVIGMMEKERRMVACGRCCMYSVCKCSLFVCGGIACVKLHPCQQASAHIRLTGPDVSFIGDRCSLRLPSEHFPPSPRPNYISSQTNDITPSVPSLSHTHSL